MALPGLVSALRSHLEPRDTQWFGYKMSEPEAQRTVAATLSRRTGMDWDPDDVAMTNGGFAAISVALRTLLDSTTRDNYLEQFLFMATLFATLSAANRGEPRDTAG